MTPSHIKHHGIEMPIAYSHIFKELMSDLKFAGLLAKISPAYLTLHESDRRRRRPRLAYFRMLDTPGM